MLADIRTPSHPEAYKATAMSTRWESKQLVFGCSRPTTDCWPLQRIGAEILVYLSETVATCLSERAFVMHQPGLEQNCNVISFSIS